MDYESELRVWIYEFGLVGCVKIVGYCMDMVLVYFVVDVVILVFMDFEVFGWIVIEV